jgi:hypothetical protein
MATQAIPYSQLVNIIPGVIGTGANPLSLNAIFIDKDEKIPTSSLLEFYDRATVVDYFGSDSDQAALAGIYFNGFDTATRRPGTLFFAGYADVARAGWVRGQSLAGVTLDELKAISGTLNVIVDGGSTINASIDLSAVTSFTDAATAIGTAIGAGVVVTWDVLFSVFVITSATTGANSSVVISGGAAAEPLGLVGGYSSAGSAIDTPTSAMDRIVTQSNDWATYMTTFEPDQDDKILFATWAGTQNQRYGYVAWDSSSAYFTPNNAATFGKYVENQKLGATLVIYDPTPNTASFICGYAASINWDELNGRATPAFKSQEGLPYTVDTLAKANAVLSNNASYYGHYSGPGAGNVDNCFQDGRMNGSIFQWFDTFINQIRLNSQLLLSIWTGLRGAKAVPYNSRGDNYIRAWAQDPINEGLNNGSIVPGVVLSNSQKVEINTQVGFDVSETLFTQGYYLHILPATAQVRGQRKSPPLKLFYCDGGSIQQIEMASIAVL